MLNQEGGALYLGNGIDGDILFGSLLFYSFRASCFVSGLCFHVVPVVTRCLHQGPRTLWRVSMSGLHIPTVLVLYTFRRGTEGERVVI